MKKFSVVKLLNNDSMVLPNVTVYKDVEIRHAKKDTEDERRHLEESIKLNAKSINIDINNRISCIVQATDEKEAVQLADGKFEEVLDVITSSHHMSIQTLSDCGFIKYLNTGQITPLNNNSSYVKSYTFMTKRYSFPELASDQYFFTYIQESELSSRYLKSLHWSRHANNENNIQLKILFYWFSVEALFKENDTDNSVSSLIRFFLGYPNGKTAKDVSKEKMDLIRSHDLYTKWKKILNDSIDSIRTFRNDSVHSGFRGFDFPKKDILLYEKIMTLGSSRCRYAVFDGINNRLETVKEFKEYSGLIFEYNSNIVNDLHGNILFMLENINKS